MRWCVGTAPVWLRQLCLAVRCLFARPQAPLSLTLLGCLDVCCRVCVAESIRALDLQYFVGPVDVPDTTYFAGYSMRQVNSTRVCETYVSDECVAKKGAEVCVDEQVCRAAHKAWDPVACSRTCRLLDLRGVLHAHPSCSVAVSLALQHGRDHFSLDLFPVSPTD
jgi:hypothetical protein